jgi:hypothetical protein
VPCGSIVAGRVRKGHSRTCRFRARACDNRSLPYRGTLDDPSDADRVNPFAVKSSLVAASNRSRAVRASDASYEISCAVLARVVAYSAGAVSTASATASPIATAVSAAPLLIKAPGMTADTPSPT